MCRLCVGCPAIKPALRLPVGPVVGRGGNVDGDDVAVAHALTKEVGAEVDVFAGAGVGGPAARQRTQRQRRGRYGRRGAESRERAPKRKSRLAWHATTARARQTRQHGVGTLVHVPGQTCAERACGQPRSWPSCWRRC